MSKKSDQLRRALCFAVLLVISSSLFAQNRVTGKITNQSDNQPIVGASIQEKGTTNGTVPATHGTTSR